MIIDTEKDNNVMKAIIFGTGGIAKRIYDRLTKKKIEVSFFLDSMLEKKEYLGKPVYSPDFIETMTDKNEYEYYLGTYTSYVGMSTVLKERGINENRIHIEKDYCLHTLETDINRINDHSVFVLYPDFKNQEEFERTVENFEDCFPRLKGSNIKIYCKGCISHRMNNFIVCDNIKYKEEYVYLVWKEENIEDLNDLGYKQILCIDSNHFEYADIRILLRFNKMLWNDAEIKSVEDTSVANFESINKKEYEKAYVMGNGPSCNEAIKKVDKESSLRIACNYFAKSEEYLELFEPNMYMLADEIMASAKCESAINDIEKYVVNSECKVCAPLEMALAIADRKPAIKKRIVTVGFAAKELKFPTRSDRELYRKAFNVITAMAVPFASSFCNLIYISGCDGSRMDEIDKENWNYNEKLKSGLKKVHIEDNWYKEYYFKHIAFFEEIIKYGNKVGKEYIYIGNTYIPILKQICKEV